MSTDAEKASYMLQMMPSVIVVPIQVTVSLTNYTNRMYCTKTTDPMNLWTLLTSLTLQTLLTPSNN